MRVTFLVDGFNLYHSAVELSRDLGGASTKWLDLSSMLGSLLPNIGKGATLEEIHYFSALAHHMEAARPGTVKRHQDYIRCLQATGVIVEMGRFKKKYIRCKLKKCRAESEYNEEKETDVAIAIKLLELFFSNRCDAAILVTGDTDLAPAVRAAARLFPQKAVGFVFPYNRKNEELAQLTPLRFRLKRDRYLKHQFPDPFVGPGFSVAKPASW